MEIKICNKCFLEKTVSSFGSLKRSKDGFRDVCKECRKIETKKYYEKNKKHYNKLSSEWNKKNKKRRKEITKKHKKLPYIKFKENIRHRIYMFFRTVESSKNKKTSNIVGCSSDFLKKYIEEQFQEGMNWENYGSKGWHIDHIIPLSSAETEDEIYKLCHYTNLRPLWWFENLKKGKKTL